MRPLALAMLALTAAGCGTSDPFPGTPVEPKAKRAAAENKIVLIDFFTTWCEPCKRMDRVPWPDARVETLSEHARRAGKPELEAKWRERAGG